MTPLFTWAWKQADLIPTHRVVLMLLAEKADETGRVVLQRGETVQHARIERSTARNAICYLASRGLIEVEKAGKGHRQQVYRLRAAP